MPDGRFPLCRTGVPANAAHARHFSPPYFTEERPMQFINAPSPADRRLSGSLTEVRFPQPAKAHCPIVSVPSGKRTQASSQHPQNASGGTERQERISAAASSRQFSNGAEPSGHRPVNARSPEPENTPHPQYAREERTAAVRSSRIPEKQNSAAEPSFSGRTAEEIWLSLNASFPMRRSPAGRTADTIPLSLNAESPMLTREEGRTTASAQHPAKTPAPSAAIPSGTTKTPPGSPEKSRNTSSGPRTQSSVYSSVSEDRLSHGTKVPSAQYRPGAAPVSFLPGGSFLAYTGRPFSVSDFPYFCSVPLPVPRTFFLLPYSDL